MSLNQLRKTSAQLAELTAARAGLYPLRRRRRTGDSTGLMPQFSSDQPGSSPLVELATIIRTTEEGPYLADYRKDVLLEAFSHEGLCGDTARDSVGTISTEYCSEFVPEVYQSAGVDSYLCGHRACLWAVTYAKQLRRIFQGDGSWVYASDADTLTPEPGDYLSMDDQDHSVLVAATYLDGRHLWRIGGNEGSADCVRFSRLSFFDDDGVINSRLYGFGKLLSSFFD